MHVTVGASWLKDHASQGFFFCCHSWELLCTDPASLQVILQSFFWLFTAHKARPCREQCGSAQRPWSSWLYGVHSPGATETRRSVRIKHCLQFYDWVLSNVFLHIHRVSHYRWLYWFFLWLQSALDAALLSLYCVLNSLDDNLIFFFSEKYEISINPYWNLHALMYVAKRETRLLLHDRHMNTNVHYMFLMWELLVCATSLHLGCASLPCPFPIWFWHIIHQRGSGGACLFFPPTCTWSMQGLTHSL